MPDTAGKPGENSLIHSSYRSVAIVIPMYNEVDCIPLLAYKIKGVIQMLSGQMKVYFVCVDDGSNDMTAQEMLAHFGGMETFHLIRHWKNMGFSQAMHTGIDKALELNADLIVTIDADTNYDHFYIPMFVSLMTPECDMLTASPWHPDGQRKYFPWHRLMLSLGMSSLYRRVLRPFSQPLFTYSACFRVAKAEVYRQIKWEGEDFMATSEIIARAIINRFQVREIPFQVNPRWFGVSKMRKLRQIKQHLKFMWKLWRNPEAFLIKGKSPSNTGKTT